jgi:hypothetical protein
MLRELIGALVWLAANGLYIDLRRKGRPGIPRVIFFWMGIPATWIWLFLVPEGKGKKKLPPPDDVQALLEEIRRDKALRSRNPSPQEQREFPEDPPPSIS